MLEFNKKMERRREDMEVGEGGRQGEGPSGADIVKAFHITIRKKVVTSLVTSLSLSLSCCPFSL